jgi:hypothetical protein
MSDWELGQPPRTEDQLKRWGLKSGEESKKGRKTRNFKKWLVTWELSVTKENSSTT